MPSWTPSPAGASTCEDPDYINPDVHVEKVGDEYVIRLNEDGLPKLRVSNSSTWRPCGPPGTTPRLGQGLHSKAPGQRPVVYPEHSPAPKDPLPGYREHRPLPERLSGQRPVSVKTPDPAPGGRRRADARIHHQPGDHRQIHAHPPGVLDMKYFFNSGINRPWGSRSPRRASRRRSVRSSTPKIPRIP